MTLDVFRVQTTFTTTLIRKAKEETDTEEEEEERGGGRKWDAKEGGRKRKMSALAIKEEGERVIDIEENEEDVIEEVIEENEKDEVAELEEAGLRKITTIRLNNEVSDRFNLPGVF